jgi:SAM-dependent methyltransferase
MDWSELQRRWDAQQQAYLPDREERFAAMLDVVGSVGGAAPHLLDLAGGTGSISLRALRRFPGATSVVVDVDDALLTIAAATFAGDDRVRVVHADLATPAWLEAVDEPPASFDAVLTATALHWLPAARIAQIYAEAGRLLRAGGVLANADHMPDAGLPSLADRLDDVMAQRTDRVRHETGATDWDGWWEELAAEPELTTAIAARHDRFAGRGGSGHTESREPASWHVQALRDAGFAEAGVVWRGLNDATVVGLRAAT